MEVRPGAKGIYHDKKGLHTEAVPPVNITQQVSPGLLSYRNRRNVLVCMWP